MSFFQDLLHTISDRGRALLPGWESRPGTVAALIEDCRRLLSSQGEASGVAIARRILDQYLSLPEEGRIAFMHWLAEDFAPPDSELDAAYQAYRSDPTPASFARLCQVCEPPRQELYRQLNLAPGGTADLVQLRADLIRYLDQYPEFAAVDFDLMHLLGSWFNRGFLVLRRIDWSTPASILAKIIRYEAVHEFQGWDDLQRRLEPPDRRCFGFFHPALPDEPLIFVQVALTETMPATIQSILRDDRRLLAASQATTAVFYSISNCQKGLKGISFGNFLIKQVVADLAAEFPNLKTFVTLSPVPGFRRWLDRERQPGASSLLDAQQRERLRLLDVPGWQTSATTSEALRSLVTALGAHYFLHTKGKDGLPPDPVARFHLGNGACLERINWLGDVSVRGVRQAAGLMVNYRYDLSHIEENHEAFVNQATVVASSAVQRLGRSLPRIKVNGKEPMSESLAAVIRAHLPTDLSRTFIQTPTGQRYRYADLLALSGRFATALTALGVKPGDRVAVQVDKSPEALLLYLGVIRAGGVYLPLNIGYTRDELRYFLADAEPTVFVCRPDFVHEAEAIAEASCGARVETLGHDATGSLMDKARDAIAEFDDIPRRGNDLAAILYTSGTTGRSKGAMLTHDNLVSNAQVLRDSWRFTSDDALLHALPLFHTHGLFVACNTVLLAGASMIFLAKFDAEQIIAQLPKATTMMGVPTFYTRLLAREDFTRERVAHMRLFTSGSAPLTADTHREFSARTGHAILERYGMTETNMTTSNPYDGERRAGTVGMPLPEVELRVVDRESGEPLSQGDIGMLEVRGPNVFKGYWRMPEKTQEEFRGDGFFITGDVGFIDDQGYVHLVGREKDLIIAGGYNIYPKEIESLIDELPGVLESAVIGLPHADLGEGVAAVVVPVEGASIDPEAIQASLAKSLARYKLPRHVFVVEELPRNTMGKVQKNLLREEYKDVFMGKG